MTEKKKAADIEKEAVKAESAEETAKRETEKFIARKMKAINEISSPAKAKRAAMRVLANRKVGKK